MKNPKRMRRKGRRFDCSWALSDFKRSLRALGDWGSGFVRKFPLIVVA